MTLGAHSGDCEFKHFSTVSIARRQAGLGIQDYLESRSILHTEDEEIILGLLLENERASTALCGIEVTCLRLSPAWRVRLELVVSRLNVKIGSVSHLSMPVISYVGPDDSI